MIAKGSRELTAYRLQQAQERLSSATILLEHSMHRDSVSRAYYAMLAAARALLAARGFEARTHSGVVSLINEHYVKTGELSRESGRRLMEAKDLREDSDYADFVEVTQADAAKQLEDAVDFVDEAGELLADNGPLAGGRP